MKDLRQLTKVLTIQKETNKNLMQRYRVKAKHGRNNKLPGNTHHMVKLLEMAINLAQGFLEARTEGVTIYSLKS